MSANPQLGMSERDRQSAVRVARAKVDVVDLLHDPERGLSKAERDEVLVDILRTGVRQRLEAEIRQDES